MDATTIHHPQPIPMPSHPNTPASTNDVSDAPEDTAVKVGVAALRADHSAVVPPQLQCSRQPLHDLAVALERSRAGAAGLEISDLNSEFFWLVQIVISSQVPMSTTGTMTPIDTSHANTITILRYTTPLDRLFRSLNEPHSLTLQQPLPSTLLILLSCTFIFPHRCFGPSRGQ